MSESKTNLNGRVLNPVIDSHLIVNTDMGLIRLIRDKFQDPRAFDLDKINKSDREILSLLYSRDNPNPLSIISTEENMNDIDELYKSFMDNYRDDIYSKSISDRGILGFVQMVMHSGFSLGINGCICVDDDFEKDQIMSHFKKGTFVYSSDKNTLLMKDAYYIKDYRFFVNNGIDKKTKHKKIYMAPYTYNEQFFISNKCALTETNQVFLFGSDYRKSKGDSNDE